MAAVAVSTCKGDQAMRKTISMLGVVGLCCGLLTGCTSSPTEADKLMQQRIETTNELADNAASLTNLKDPAALKKGNDRGKELSEKLARLKADFEKQPRDQQEAAGRKYGVDLAQAEAKLAANVGGALFDGMKDLGGDLNKGLGDATKDIHKGIDDGGKDVQKDFNKDFPKDFNKDFPKDFPKP
jgi:hypothetical protein